MAVHNLHGLSTYRRSMSAIDSDTGHSPFLRLLLSARTGLFADIRLPSKLTIPSAALPEPCTMKLPSYCG